MTKPARRDIDIWVGNSHPLAFAFKSSDTVTTTSYPLAGIRVNFTVFNGDEKLVLKTTEDSSISVTNDQIDLILTPDDTRIIAGSDYALGARPIYEIEFWNGVYDTPLS